jgi:thermitase
MKKARSSRFLRQYKVFLTALAVIAFSGLYLAYQRYTYNTLALHLDDGDTEEYVPATLLVKFKDDTPNTRAQHILESVGGRIDRELPDIGVNVVRLGQAGNERALAAALARNPQVEFAEVDALLKPASQPNDPYYSGNWSWHLSQIRAPEAWTHTLCNAGVKIAILDSGIFATHQDLQGKVLPGWNVYSNNDDTTDQSGHGTAVGGVAGALTNNGLGISAVGWNCSLLPVKVTKPEGGSAFSSHLVDGITYAKNNGARVVNISFRAWSSSTIQSAARSFMAEGGVVVVSAGNDGTFHTAPDSPELIVVGAVESNDTLTSYSNTGAMVDLCASKIAPTTHLDNRFGFSGGTSIAAPIVSGVAALVLAANPSLTAYQVRDILYQSARDVFEPGRDTSCGHGIVDAGAAVRLALGITSGPSDTTPPTVSLTAPAAGATVSGSVTLNASATDNVGVTKVEFYVGSTLLATSTAAPYTTSWNTLAIPNGSYTLTAKAYDAAQNVGTSTAVTVTVNNQTDTTPPTAEITAPSNGATLSGTSVTVSARVSDNVGVTKVDFLHNGRVVKSVTKISGSTVSTSLNTRKWANGFHTLQVIAHDQAGNRGESAIITVRK